LIALLVVALLGVSAAIARIGVAYSSLDTVQFVVRWRERETELAPLSISASIQQFVLGILTLPAVKALNPGALYQPAFSPSLELLAIAGLIAVVFLLATALLWSGHIQWRAPEEQQREADRNA
jgi:hypothetical protein